MAYQYAEFLGRSERLLAAGRQLLISFEDEQIDQPLAIEDLISVTQQAASKDLEMHYAAMPATHTATAQPARPEDLLSGVLLDLQSANLLMSAGLALNETGARGDTKLVSEALQHVENAQSIITQDQACEKLGYAPAAIHSQTVEAARKVFDTNSEAVLSDFVDQAASVVNCVVEQLKKLDGAKILEALGRLGEAVPMMAAAGRLIRRGVEILKNAIDALTNLFGKQAVARVKDKIQEIWNKAKSGQYTKDTLAWAFDVAGAQQRIKQDLDHPNLKLDSVDGASNALNPLSDDYKRNMKLLSGLATGIGFAAVVLGYLHIAAPWLPLALAFAYFLVVASTLLVGTEYCGSNQILHWVRGVVQIADGMQTV